MKKYKENRKTNYLKHLHRVWVKSDKRGIRLVEMYGFKEVRLFDAPNEIHIEAFLRWVKLICNKLGVTIPDGPEEYD